MLSKPADKVVQSLARTDGDILILGVGGKIGPSLARMAKRAFEAAGQDRQIVGVSRFPSRKLQTQLESHGIRTIRCDLLDERRVNSLPDSPNIIYLPGMKFGSAQDAAMTWAMNSYLPAIICKRFQHSRIVALSTGNVYGLVPITAGGSRESDAPTPIGEYAMSCLGRERLFQYFSRKYSIPITVLRLNYACDLRYGVLVDLAQRIAARRTIDLSMGYFNTIWQGDANAMILQSLLHTASPPLVLNVTGPEQLSVREVCKQMGRILGRKPRFVGTEAATALLSNPRKACRLFGSPAVNADQLVHWVASWVRRNRPLLGKPTLFESRDGKF